MECIIYRGLKKGGGIISLSGDEARPLRALRARPGGRFLVTNGAGLTAASLVTGAGKSWFELEPLRFHENYSEAANPLGIAIGVLESRDRFEFALEKAVELGASDFYPLLTDFTQKKKVNMVRLKSKAEAALKQCRRSRLPLIHEPKSLRGLIEASSGYSSIIVGDADGAPFSGGGKDGRTLAVVGPEGGFSQSEVDFLRGDERVAFIKLSTRRLRSETAAVVALSLIAAEEARI